MIDPWARRRRLFVTWQLAVVTGILALGALSYAVPPGAPDSRRADLAALLDVGGEANLPTFVSTVNLLVAGLLCALIQRAASLRGERAPRQWLLLGAVFVGLAADEAAQLHELLRHARGLFPDTSLVNVRHAWLLAGAPVALFLAAAMVPFLVSLPRNLSRSFLLAGVLFAAGVLGWELVGSLMLRAGIGVESPLYQARRLCEEACEMYGIALFNCAAVGELARHAAHLRWVVTTPPAGPGAVPPA
jgi:hypothetical protein